MICWFSEAVIGAFRSSVSECYSLGGPLWYGSPVVVFLDRGHPCFRNLYSTIPVDVVWLKAHMNRLFDPVCIPMRVTINKLYFVPKQVVSGDVRVFGNGDGLGTDKPEFRSCSLIRSCIGVPVWPM